MSKRPQFFLLIVTFLFCASHASARLGEGLDFSKQSKIGSKRVERQVWKSEGNKDFMKKSFEIQEWDKHFSSVGSKRAPISFKEDRDKKIFQTNTKEFPIKEYDMAGWNEKFMELSSNAQISTDDKAQKIADRKLYQMMMRNAENYSDLGENLSLRDINKYQFRRNRSDGELPVSKVGQQ